MGSKAKPATQTINQTVSSNPWAGATSDLTNLMTQSRASFDQGNNLAQTAIANTQADAARIRAQAADLASGRWLDPNTNPTLQGMVASAINPLREQLTQNVLGIGDAAQQQGAYGGSRQGVVEGAALRGFNRDAMDAANRIYYDNYTRERQNMLGASQLYGAATGLDQSVPAMAWGNTNNLAQILQTLTPYATETTNGTQVGTAAKASGAQSGLSGALGGASAGAAFGPWGAGIGAVLGGLGGLFG